VTSIRARGAAAVNGVLRPFGLRIQRVSSPTRSFTTFFEHLKANGLNFKTVVDVGVARGTPSIYRSFPHANYFLVEPLVEFSSDLRRLSSTLKATVVPAVAGEQDGETEIFVHADLSGSSVLRQAEGAALDGAPRRVPSVRLDSILPRDLERPCLLKIDTQGTELEVVAGLGPRLREIDLMLIEASLFPFRSGAPLLADLVARLGSQGYVVYDILEGHTRALDGALAQVDLAFVPSESPLRRDSRFFSEEQMKRYLGRARA
jgi:FkbM family methyltransferase